MDKNRLDRALRDAIRFLTKARKELVTQVEPQSLMPPEGYRLMIDGEEIPKDHQRFTTQDGWHDGLPWMPGEIYSEVNHSYACPIHLKTPWGYSDVLKVGEKRKKGICLRINMMNRNGIRSPA